MSDIKKPVRKKAKKKKYIPKHKVQSTPSEKRTLANRENIKKANLMLGSKASRKSPVRRDLPRTLVDQRITSLLTREFIGRVISQYSLSTLAEVTKAAHNRDLSMIERIVCKIIIKAWKNEDIFRLEFLLQRSVGKVTDKLELTAPTQYSHLSMEELKKLHAEKAAKNLEFIREIEKKEIEVKTIELDLKDYSYNDIDGEDTESIFEDRSDITD